MPQACDDRNSTAALHPKCMPLALGRPVGGGASGRLWLLIIMCFSDWPEIAAGGCVRPVREEHIMIM